MTEKTATNLLATIQDIHKEATQRYGQPPARAYTSGVMKNRIIQEICDTQMLIYEDTRRKAYDGMKLMGIRFVVDHRMPDNEIHFCTKRRELMVRVKVDQLPPPSLIEHTLLEAAAHRSAHPSAEDNAGASASADPSVQTDPIATAS